MARVVMDFLVRDRASAQLDKIGKKTDETAGRFDGLKSGIKTGAAVAGTALVALGVSSIRVASSITEAQSKVEVVFGQSAKSVKAFAETGAEAFNISKRSALEATGTFGNLLTAMKVTQPESAKMSVNMVKLAADMASFNDASPEDVLEALRSGLVGETEPLKRFGVNLSAARIEAEALATGIVKPAKNMGLIRVAAIGVEAAEKKLSAAIKEHGSESIEAQKAEAALILARQRQEKALGGQKVALTEAQKAQAAYSLILKDTKNAQGDVARTSGSLANQQRDLRQRFEDLQGTLGEKLLPLANKVLGWAIKFAGWVERNQNVVIPLVAAFGALTAATWAMNIAMAANPIGLVIAAVAGLAVGLVIAWKKSQTFREVVTTVFSGAGIVVLTFVKLALKGIRMVTEGWLTMASTIIGIMAKIPGPQQKMFKALHAGFDGFRADTKRAFDAAEGKIDEWTANLAKMPKVVKLQGNIKDLDQKIKQAEKEIKDVPKSKRTEFQGRIDDLKRKRAQAQAELNKLQNKVVNVVLNASMSKTAISILAQNSVSLSREHLNRRAAGGILPGPPSSRDNMVIHAASGEFVVNAHSTQKHRALLEAVNSDRLPGFAFGGVVGEFRRGMDASSTNIARRGGNLLSKAMLEFFSTTFGGGVPTSVSGNAAIVKNAFASMFGWARHWPATYKLLMGESGFRNTAQNPTSSAYGMFQFLNSTWGTVGGRKTSDPYLQSVYGGRYIRNAYGNPSTAYSRWLGRSPHWYDRGGYLMPGLTLAYNGTGKPERVLPPGRNGGDVHLHLTVGGVVGMTRQDLKNELRKMLTELNKGGRVSLA